MRTRKKEIDAIADLLSSEHEDVDSLAADVWRLVDNLRRDRELYVVATRLVGGVNVLFGPYESKTTAEKDLEKGQIKALQKGDKYMIMRVIAPSNFYELENPTLFDSR